MFFSISQTIEHQFDYCYSSANWKINVDQGWTSQENKHRLILFKGYCDQYSMDYLINVLPTQQTLTGNFCVIIATSNGIDLIHSQPRSFPLWHGQNTLTNFSPKNNLLSPVWVDTSVHINSAGEFCFEKNNNVTWISQPLSKAHATEQIVELLITRAKQFKKQCQLPVNIYRSGGIDTTLVQALCNNVGIDTVQVDHPSLPTSFVSKNKSTLDCFWAYQQLHFWEYDSCIATGSHGDEYFLRGPDAIALITAWRGIDFLALVNQHPECYHYHYFNRDANRNKFQSQYDQRSQLTKLYPTWNDLCLQICNMLSNDHQHWHLGKTLTWTPFKEISFAHWCLNIPFENLLDNFLNATIPRQCIDMLDSNLSKSIDQFKNHRIL
jgi:hypothetical protein